MKAASVALGLFLLLLWLSLCYSKPHHDPSTGSELRVREKREAEQQEDDRKKAAEDRRKAFQERKEARERGQPDPVQKTEETKMKNEEFERKITETNENVNTTSGGKNTSQTGGARGRQKNYEIITTLNQTRRINPTSKPEDPNTKRGNADSRTDTALSIVRSVLIDDEPMELAEPGPCKTCEILGVSSVERTGRATAIDMGDDHKRVKVYLGLRYLNATCNCTFGIVSGTVHASVQKLVIYLDIIVNFETDETIINTLTLKYPGDLDLNFSGSGILGWIAEQFTNLFKSTILSTLRAEIIAEIPKLVHEHKDHLHHIGMI